MAVALLLLVSVSSKVYAMPVLAGAGTPENPKRISSCFQLDNLLNSLPGYTIFNQNYLITNNLDCTGYTFDNTTIINNVTIDGGYHRITNINLGLSGLVYVMNTSIIKNLWLASGNNNSAPYFYGGSFASQMNTTSSLINVKSSLYLNCSGLCGGLVGAAHDSNITKSVFDGTVNGGSYTGGLVGTDIFDNTNNVTISKSAFLGTLNSPSYAGGILGSHANNVLIANSYSNGTYDLGPYSGGLIGAFNDQITIDKSYTNGSGNLDTGSGGMIGAFNSDINVYNSYSLLFSKSNDSGNVEGNGNSSVLYSNTKYLNMGFGKCTKTSDVSGCSEFTSSFEADTFPSVYGFDLTNTWEQEVSKPPTLRLPNFGDPEGIPNNGDMNDDGTLDTFQGNIALLKNASNQWVAIETKDSNGCTIGEANILDNTSIPKYSGYTMSSDYLGFNVYCIDPGQSFTTNIILNRNIDISKAQLMFYNPTTMTYSKINATYTHKTVGGQIFTVLSYTLTDGGPLDRDGISNGKIEDPVVLAINNGTTLSSTSSSTPNTPNTGAGQYTPTKDPSPIGVFAFGLLLITSLLAYKKYFSKTKS